MGEVETDRHLMIVGIRKDEVEIATGLLSMIGVPQMDEAETDLHLMTVVLQMLATGSVVLRMAGVGNGQWTDHRLTIAMEEAERDPLSTIAVLLTGEAETETGQWIDRHSMIEVLRTEEVGIDQWIGPRTMIVGRLMEEEEIGPWIDPRLTTWVLLTEEVGTDRWKGLPLTEEALRMEEVDPRIDHRLKIVVALEDQVGIDLRSMTVVLPMEEAATDPEMGPHLTTAVWVEEDPPSTTAIAQEVGLRTTIETDLGTARRLTAKDPAIDRQWMNAAE